MIVNETYWFSHVRKISSMDTSVFGEILTCKTFLDAADAANVKWMRVEAVVE